MNTFYIISTHTFIYFFIFFKSTLAKKYRLMTNTGIHNSMSCLSMVPPKSKNKFKSLQQNWTELPRISGHEWLQAMFTYKFKNLSSDSRKC